MSLYRRYALPALESPSARGRGFKTDKKVFYLLAVGVLKEAFDAFRELDRCKEFPEGNLSDDSEFQERRRRLADAASKDSESFYTKHLKHLRDSAAFHWNGVEKFRNELVKRPHDVWPALFDVPSSTPKPWEVAIPIADSFLACYAPSGEPTDQIPPDIAQVFTLIDDLSFYVQKLLNALK